MLEAYVDLVRRVDRLRGGDHRAVFGDLEDYERVWRGGIWEEKGRR